eukprot:snap_masked-scaffold_11-processed-gene-7.48-mRNA-1 protein AED:1.00 eAED:1.00 QI:0/0/0/0/1/1/2/0/648
MQKPYKNNTSASYLSLVNNNTKTYLRSEDFDELLHQTELKAPINSENRNIPKFSNLETLLRERTTEGGKYEPGMCVEFKINEFDWEIGEITSVFQPNAQDFVDIENQKFITSSVYYLVNQKFYVNEKNVRVPRDTLNFVFGKRPFLWQQLTILQLEKVFHSGKKIINSYENINPISFASSRFNIWLNHPENEEFKAVYQAQPEISQQLLLSYLLTPFEEIYDVIHNHKKWDFQDKEISLYSYGGVATFSPCSVFSVLVLQIVAPILLVIYSMYLSDGDPNIRFDVVLDEESSDAGKPLNGNLIPSTSFNQFCSGIDGDREIEHGYRVAKAVLFFVLYMYTWTIVKDVQWNSLYHSNLQTSTASKISYLQEKLWKKGFPKISIFFWHRVEVVMRSTYLCFASAALLFILFNTVSALDIFLNALAFNFLEQLDKKIASTPWFDPGKQKIKSGVIELIIMNYIEFKTLAKYKSICVFFDIRRDDYIKQVGKVGLRSKKLALKDQGNEDYLTCVEKYLNNFEHKAQKKVGEQDKNGNTAKFNWGFPFRVWSRWDQILFLPRVPYTVDTVQKNSIQKSFQSTKRIFKGKSKTALSLIFGRDIISSLITAWRNASMKYRFILFFLGLIELSAFYLRLLFPLLFFVWFLFVAVCY